jgi:hypothetical protein
MTIFEDPSGAIQSYAASIMAVLVSVTSSNTWSAVIAVLAALLLIIRLYKEIKGLTKDKEE